MTDLSTKNDIWANIESKEIEQNCTGDQQLISIHQQLQQYIQQLSSNAELVNTHCYLIDEFTENCKENIERACLSVTSAIDSRKKNLLNHLYTIQKSKTSTARDIFISISKELKLCQSIKLEIEHRMACETQPSQAYVSQLYSKINEMN
eukprot:743145_1